MAVGSQSKASTLSRKTVWNDFVTAVDTNKFSVGRAGKRLFLGHWPIIERIGADPEDLDDAVPPYWSNARGQSYSTEPITQ